MGTIETLKPCPFCGGAAEVVHIEDGENAGGSCVSCTVCIASSNVEFEFKENFVSNWNRRKCDDTREALTTINRLASPNPSRTFDDAIRDLEYIADFARYALQKATPQEIR